MSDAEIEIEILGQNVEVYIKYSTYGDDAQATHFEPAEYAEIEIDSIQRTIDNEEIEISGMFTTEEREKIEVILQAYLDEGD